jgi:hypothetical protein
MSREIQTLKDLVTMDDGVMGPNGDKADYIRDKAAEHLDMTVKAFCEDVIQCGSMWVDNPSESYVRRVLRECRPESVAMFDIDEIQIVR